MYKSGVVQTGSCGDEGCAKGDCKKGELCQCNAIQWDSSEKTKNLYHVPQPFADAIYLAFKVPLLYCTLIWKYLKKNQDSF